MSDEPLEQLAALALDRAAPADARVRAVAALSQRDAARYDAAVDALAADPSADVRAAAVLYADRLDAARAEALVRVALEDASSRVRCAVHYAVVRHRIAGIAPLLVDALQRLEERLRREKPEFGFWDRRYEEDALLKALAASTGAPGFAALIKPIRAWLQAIAADPDNDDVEEQIFLYRNARAVLDAAGIKA